ncbi:MAG: benzylsuccinate synthase beta subunit family protein [Clostridia bacterium]|nr:benzylsuccinate synthase beta subunit family protein [Clostridia bacterium]
MAQKNRFDIVKEPGTTKSCSNCKWGKPDSVNPAKGNCVGSRNHLGGIWKRMIPDYYNCTCSKFEEGEIDFREHV